MTAVISAQRAILLLESLAVAVFLDVAIALRVKRITMGLERPATSRSLALANLVIPPTLLRVVFGAFRLRARQRRPGLLIRPFEIFHANVIVVSTKNLWSSRCFGHEGQRKSVEPGSPINFPHLTHMAAAPPVKSPIGKQAYCDACFLRLVRNPISKAEHAITLGVYPCPHCGERSGAFWVPYKLINPTI